MGDQRGDSLRPNVKRTWSKKEPHQAGWPEERKREVPGVAETDGWGESI